MEHATTLDAQPGLNAYNLRSDIGERRRPLSAYQLLGLTAKEGDTDAILTAVALKRRDLVARRGEVSLEDWNQIYREVDEAASMLLNPGRKAAYDADMQMPEDTHLSMHAAGATAARADNVLDCTRCKTRNPSTRKFCAQCGDPLWEPCVHCGNTCPTGERFCGACGANLTAAVHQQTEEFELSLVTVEQLQAEGRYEEAVALLGPMSTMTHPRLTHRAKMAAELSKRLVAERQQRLSQAEEVYDEGERLISEHDYDAAITTLEAVPAPLRSADFQELLDLAIARKQEVASLGEELRAAIGAKDFSKAMPKIARLLDLKPEHAQAQQLGQQLQERYARAAEAKLAQCRYEEAAKLIGEVPQSIETPKTGALRERVAELAWIAWDLRSAPVVDGPLLAMVERLQTLAPTDQRAPKFLDEMQRRCKHAAKNGSVAMPPWASKPGDTPWGFPIDCITGFQRITLDEKLDRTPLVENPGCFAVACGLAIQGLGQAHVQIDLRPAASKSAIKAVTGLFRQRYASQAWGLDLGSSSVKAVKLAWDKKTETISMESAALVQYKKPLSQAASEEEEQAIIEEAMTAFLAQNELKADHVCLSLPGRLVLTRIFQLPTSDRTKMSTMVQFEAKRHAPTNLDQLDWDFQPLAAPDEEDDSASAKQSETKKGSTAVLFVASRSKLVRKRIDLMKRLGVRVESAQSECIALHNFLMYDLAPPAQSEATNGNAEAARPKWPIAVVDVGGDGGNLLVSSPTGVWVRHLGFGGYSVTRALIKYFNLTAAQADELKRNPAAAPSISEIYRTLEPIMDDFSRELGVSLAAYAKADHYEPVERMYCLGGGFQLHGLLAYLRTASNDEA